MKKSRKPNRPTQEQIDEFLDDLYLNVGTTVPGGVFSAAGQEIILKSLTQFVVSVCAAWWSIHELMDLLRNRQTYKEALYGQSTATPS